MYENEDIGLTVGENLLQVCGLLRETVGLVERAGYGSPEEKIHLKEATNAVIKQIERTLLAEILPHHRLLRETSDEAYMRERHHLYDLTRRSELSTERAEELTFPEKESAYVMRQAMFNVNYVLGRACAVHTIHTGVDPAEKCLLTFRIAMMMGETLSDIFDDLYIAHPDLWIRSPGEPEIDWQRFKRMRDECRDADGESDDELDDEPDDEVLTETPQEREAFFTAAKESVQLRHWVGERNLKPFVMMLSELIDYEFGAGDWEEIACGVETSSLQEQQWYRHKLVGVLTAEIAFARRWDSGTVQLELMIPKAIRSPLELAVGVCQEFEVQERE